MDSQITANLPPLTIESDMWLWEDAPPLEPLPDITAVNPSPKHTSPSKVAGHKQRSKVDCKLLQRTMKAAKPQPNLNALAIEVKRVEPALHHVLKTLARHIGTRGCEKCHQVAVRHIDPSLQPPRYGKVDCKLLQRTMKAAEPQPDLHALAVEVKRVEPAICHPKTTLRKHISIKGCKKCHQVAIQHIDLSLRLPDSPTLCGSIQDSLKIIPPQRNRRQLVDRLLENPLITPSVHLLRHHIGPNGCNSCHKLAQARLEPDEIKNWHSSMYV